MFSFSSGSMGFLVLVLHYCFSFELAAAFCIGDSPCVNDAPENGNLGKAAVPSNGLFIQRHASALDQHGVKASAQRECFMMPLCTSCDISGSEVLIGSAHTLSSCKAACLDDVTCLGIDFGKNDRAGKCYKNTAQKTDYVNHDNYDAWTCGQAIRGVMLSESSTCPDGWSRVQKGATRRRVLNGDLNQEAGGKDIYLCQTTTRDGRKTEGSSELTDLLLADYQGCPSGWYYIQKVNTLNGNLNEDADGKYTYLCQKTGGSGSSFVTDLKLYDWNSCPSGWYNIQRVNTLNGDLNQDAGGKTIYLCQRTQIKEVCISGSETPLLFPCNCGNVHCGAGMVCGSAENSKCYCPGSTVGKWVIFKPDGLDACSQSVSCSISKTNSKTFALSDTSGQTDAHTFTTETETSLMAGIEATAEACVGVEAETGLMAFGSGAKVTGTANFCATVKAAAEFSKIVNEGDLTENYKTTESIESTEKKTEISVIFEKPEEFALWVWQWTRNQICPLSTYYETVEAYIKPRFFPASQVHKSKYFAETPSDSDPPCCLPGSFKEGIAHNGSEWLNPALGNDACDATSPQFFLCPDFTCPSTGEGLPSGPDSHFSDMLGLEDSHLDSKIDKLSECATKCKQNPRGCKRFAMHRCTRTFKPHWVSDKDNKCDDADLLKCILYGEETIGQLLVPGGLSERIKYKNGPLSVRPGYAQDYYTYEIESCTGV